MKKRILSTLLTITMVMVFLSGCGKVNSDISAESIKNESPESSNTYTIGYAPTTMNNAFWLAVLEGVKKVAEENNVKIVTIDSQNDQTKMNDQVGDLLSSGIDALLVAPIDSTGVQDALKACAAKNVPVINFDTPVVNKDLVKSIIASNNYDAGKIVAEDMMKKLEKDSKIFIMHSPSGQACIDRYNGFVETTGNYFNIVGSLDGKGDTGVTLPLAEDVLQSTPDLKAFFAINDPSAIGCTQAIVAHPEFSGVLVYGVDGNPDAKKLIKEGKMTGTAAQSPESIGKLSAEKALSVLNGENVEKNISVDTFMINKDNVENYSTDGWQ